MDTSFKSNVSADACDVVSRLNPNTNPHTATNFRIVSSSLLMAARWLRSPYAARLPHFRAILARAGKMVQWTRKRRSFCRSPALDALHDPVRACVGRRPGGWQLGNEILYFTGVTREGWPRPDLSVIRPGETS